jgi:SAM-dependent methyltransferase
VLAREVPGVRTAVGGAEQIPLPDSSVDAVIAGQAFHWFDLGLALPEIARVLRPGGRVCLLWNLRNEKIPWVRRLGAIIGSAEEQRDWAQALIFSELFGFVEDRTFSHWQTIDRDSVRDLVLSRSNVAVLDEQGRAAKLAAVSAFYDDYGRGMDGMQLPYNTRCFRADVLETAKTDRPAPDDDGDADDPPSGSAASTASTDGPDDDMLLIDFR